MTTEPKNLKALEAATPELIAKLAGLTNSLSPEEKIVFAEIIESAALHTNLVQAHDEGDKAILNDKPKSVHSTIEMKRQFADLPRTLGLVQGEG